MFSRTQVATSDPEQLMAAWGVGAYPAAPPAAPFVDVGGHLDFPAGYPRAWHRSGQSTPLPTETMPVYMLLDVYKTSSQGVNPVEIEQILVPSPGLPANIAAGISQYLPAEPMGGSGWEG